MKPAVKLSVLLERAPVAVREAVLKAMPDANQPEVMVCRRDRVVDVKDADESKRSATIYLSTRHLDRDNDIVTPDGWDLSFYKMNPVGLWSHDYRSDPIYSAADSTPDDIGLRQHIVFAETERGENYWNLVKTGFLKTFSAGFRSTESIYPNDPAFQTTVAGFRTKWPEFTDEHARQVVRIVSKKTLFESSLCNIPANPFAMVVAIHKGTVKVCEAVRGELKVDDYIRKAVDDGVLGKEYARDGRPKPTTVRAVVSVKAAKVPVVVKAVVTEADVADAVRAAIQKKIAKVRGAI